MQRKKCLCIKNVPRPTKFKLHHFRNVNGGNDDSFTFTTMSTYKFHAEIKCSFYIFLFSRNKMWKKSLLQNKQFISCDIWRKKIYFTCRRDWCELQLKICKIYNKNCINHILKLNWKNSLETHFCSCHLEDY